MEKKDQLKNLKDDSSDITINKEESDKIKNIGNNNTNVVLKCNACGTEVIMNMKDISTSKCHWCGNKLSIEEKVDCGEVPDLILPFKITKEEAKEKIKQFVQERKKHIKNDFINKFEPDNIIGVYFPYILIDTNIRGKFSGIGKHLVSIEYATKEECYYLEREFDMYIDDLSLETDQEKTDIRKINKVINIVMPFDTENCVKYKDDYLIGYNAEKRDINIEDFKLKVNNKIKMLARNEINEELEYYDGGINWDEEKIYNKGRNLETVYLPIWFYSYFEKDDINNDNYFIAVNGRTGETMGNIPFKSTTAKIKTILMTIMLTIVGVIPGYLNIASSSYEEYITIYEIIGWIWIVIWIIISIAIGKYFYKKMVKFYKNECTRYELEKQTKVEINIIKKIDKKIESNNNKSK